MLYAAEIYTAAGELSSTYDPHGAAPLTPKGVLSQCLEGRLPSIFELDSAAPEQLRCVGLALPLLSSEGVRACVSLLWQIVPEFAAALEIWRPVASGVLRLGDSFYAPQPVFQRVSRRMAFSVLEGLPGLTFDAAKPVIFETLSQNKGFLRAEAAAEAGLTTGLGIPVWGDNTVSCAVVLLSSAATPLACACEVWHPGAQAATRAAKGSRSLKLDSSYTLATPYKPNAAFAESVWKQRLPGLEHTDTHLLLGLPIFRDKQVGAVVVLKF